MGKHSTHAIVIFSPSAFIVWCLGRLARKLSKIEWSTKAIRTGIIEKTTFILYPGGRSSTRFCGTSGGLGSWTFCPPQILVRSKQIDVGTLDEFSAWCNDWYCWHIQDSFIHSHMCRFLAWNYPLQDSNLLSLLPPPQSFLGTVYIVQHTYSMHTVLNTSKRSTQAGFGGWWLSQCWQFWRELWFWKTLRFPLNSRDISKLPKHIA